MGGDGSESGVSSYGDAISSDRVHPSESTAAVVALVLSWK